jgi:threonine/homoserine/homoserine lactone efflux protein
MSFSLAFLPDADTFLLFTVAAVILFATPGPDMSLFLAKTVQGGRAAGIAAMAGAMTGAVVHTMLAALGVSALLAASETGFTILKWVGGLYLLWLAIDAVRNGSALSVKASGPNRLSLRATWLLGLGVNLTNPKVILFFVTFLPQFVAASDPHATGKLVFLGLYFIAVSVPLAILMILGAERVLTTVRARPRLLRGIDLAFAGVFGLFALKILTTTR